MLIRCIFYHIILSTITSKPAPEVPNPLIPEIVELSTPAMVAFYEAKSMIGRPDLLASTIDRRSLMKEMPFRRFYDALKMYRDDPKLKPGWECAATVELSVRHARDIARKVAAGEDQIEGVKDVLLGLDLEYKASMREMRMFEQIRRHNLNFHISLVKLAIARMDEVKRQCPALRHAMADLEDSLQFKPEDIKEDNEMWKGETEPEDSAPLIAMTIIGIVSVLLNVAQGVAAAQHGYARIETKSPLIKIANK